MRIAKIEAADPSAFSLHPPNRPLPTASRNSAFTRVCQPLPVARKAASTSAENCWVSLALNAI
jgi:hypothetical protein